MPDQNRHGECVEKLKTQLGQVILGKADVIENIKFLLGGTVVDDSGALDKARVVLCLDADLLCSHPAAVRHARDFAAGREVVVGQMNRLYAVETSPLPCGEASGSQSMSALGMASAVWHGRNNISQT